MRTKYESLIYILCFQNSNISCFEMNILFIVFINRMSRLSSCILHTDHYCGAIRHFGLINISDGMAYLLSIKPYRTIFVRMSFDNILAILY